MAGVETSFNAAGSEAASKRRSRHRSASAGSRTEAEDSLIQNKRRGKAIITPRSSKRSRSKLQDIPQVSPAVTAAIMADGKSLMSPSRKDLKKLGKGKLVDENLLLVERNRAMEDIQIEYSSDVRALHDEIDALKQQLAEVGAERDQWKEKCEAHEASIKRGAEREWRSFVNHAGFH